MRSTRGWFVLLVALLAGCAAVAFAARWMQSQSGGAGRIAVAVADVQLGAKLSSDQLRMVAWPADSVPPGAFNDLAELEGRVVKSSLARGEPVIDAKLAPKGTKGGLSAVVAEGKRAMTVRVNDVVGVAGFALPSNFVDVMVNTQEEGARQGDGSKAISKIVLERILVLAVAQEADRDETKPKVVNAVTLEVSPSQAENLDLARSVGSLSLVLRNQIETEAGRTAGATKSTLLGEEPKPVVVAAAPAPVAKPAPRRAPPASAPIAAPVVAKAACVEVIRGTTKSSECF